MNVKPCTSPREQVPSTNAVPWCLASAQQQRYFACKAPNKSQWNIQHMLRKIRIPHFPSHWNNGKPCTSPCGQVTSASAVPWSVSAQQRQRHFARETPTKVNTKIQGMPRILRIPHFHSHWNNSKPCTSPREQVTSTNAVPCWVASASPRKHFAHEAPNKSQWNNSRDSMKIVYSTISFTL